MPITTTFRVTLTSNGEQQNEPGDHDAEAEAAKVAILELRDRCKAAAPSLRRREWKQAFYHEIESQTREKIRPGQSLKPP